MSKVLIRDLVKSKVIEAPMDGNHGELHPTAKDYVPTGIPFLMATDIENGVVKLSCSTVLGQAYDEFDIEMSGDSVEIGFNVRYMLDALRNTDTDEVKICLSGPTSPMVILPSDGDSFLFLVLPVRLKNEN